MIADCPVEEEVAREVAVADEDAGRVIIAMPISVITRQVIIRRICMSAPSVAGQCVIDP
jgi:hypothetical protein